MTETYDADEYETLAPHASPFQYALAGSLAGIAEHTFMFPVDVVKTRMHRQRPSPGSTYNGVLDGVRSIFRAEGAGGLFRGFGVTFLGAGPAHAMYYGAYEQAKFVLGVHDTESASVVGTNSAAVAATFAHEAFMTPVEVVKQRLQIHNTPYKGAIDCIAATFKKEGFFAFYRSFSTQLLMSIPFQCTHLTTYEQLCCRLNPSRQYDPKTHLIAGGVAGALASALTNPFDVAKTLLNTQEPLVENQRIAGVMHAFRTVYRVNGMQGFAKGLTARVFMAAPATAVSWSVYEFFKESFGLKTDPEDGPHHCC